MKLKVRAAALFATYCDLVAWISCPDLKFCVDDYKVLLELAKHIFLYSI